MDPLRAAGLIPEGFVAPQSKVSTFSFVAPCVMEEFLAALPARVLQQALRRRRQGLPVTLSRGCPVFQVRGKLMSV
jgi:hypothetical protein